MIAAEDSLIVVDKTGTQKWVPVFSLEKGSSYKGISIKDKKLMFTTFKVGSKSTTNGLSIVLSNNSSITLSSNSTILCYKDSLSLGTLLYKKVIDIRKSDYIYSPYKKGNKLSLISRTYLENKEFYRISSSLMTVNNIIIGGDTV